MVVNIVITIEKNLLFVSHGYIVIFSYRKYTEEKLYIYRVLNSLCFQFIRIQITASECSFFLN